MVMQINATGLVTLFLQRYKIWKDHKQFYQNTNGPVATISENGISCFHYTDIARINACSSKLVAIDCLTEGLHSAQVFNQYSTGKHYLIFSNGWWDITKHPLKINYSLINSYYVLLDMADTYNTPMKFCYYIDKEYKFTETKPMIFVSTIGNVRPERTYLVDQLTQQLEYNNYILKYSGQDLGVDSSVFDVISVCPGEFDPYIELFNSYYHTISQTLPIKLYNQARFNLVVETDIDYQDEFFPTEKIVKALLTGMPFVVVSTPLFLEHLRNLGFVTYGDFWDESYDTELDYQKRIKKIVNLCNQLNHFEWDKHRAELELIQLKNRNNFLNLHRVIDKDFLNFERIVEELDL
jgi:hypothetical protein